MNIKKILEEHRMWVESEGREGKRADFSYKDLSGTDFSGEFLENSRFTGAILSNCKFVNAKLAEAAMSATCLDKADFTGADCTYALQDWIMLILVIPY